MLGTGFIAEELSVQHVEIRSADAQLLA